MSPILPRPPFIVSKWYWAVAGSTTQVYSSAAAAYVPITDPTYVSWLAVGNKPTAIATETELADYLAANYPAGVGALVGPVPTVVPLWAARAALRILGQFAVIDSYVTSVEATNPVLWEAWNMGSDVDRTSDLVAQFAAQFGFTSASLDALFYAAAKIARGA